MAQVRAQRAQGIAAIGRAFLAPCLYRRPGSAALASAGAALCVRARCRCGFRIAAMRRTDVASNFASRDASGYVQRSRPILMAVDRCFSILLLLTSVFFTLPVPVRRSSVDDGLFVVAGEGVYECWYVTCLFFWGSRFPSDTPEGLIAIRSKSRRAALVAWCLDWSVSPVDAPTERGR